MAIQTAVTGNLENAQRIVIEQARYTAEHNAPMLGLVEHFTLGKGEKSITVPKVAQMTASALTDGVDLADSQDIGMTTTTLTTSEVGLKVILTDKLVRQENEDVFRIVGRQAGDAVARKKDTDLLTLFSSLNGGTGLGSSGRDMELGNLAVLIGWAKANKLPKPVHIVGHPWQTLHVAMSVFGYGGGAPGAAAGAALASNLANEMLRDFFEFRLGDVDVYQDGNITVDSSNDAVAAVFSEAAMCYTESVGFNQETERDASLRATELVVTCDYGVFEIDDGYGAPATFRSTEATA